ncbi:MAG: response regulator [Xanthomonadaceae bacterium]|nr:response regulator [Xanthomonadaceae bacterium]
MNAPPALLLVEDDPISAAYLCEALRTLPAEVTLAASAREALDHVRARRYDLWLIDAHLPDGLGVDLLATLRQLAQTPALAVTADDRPEQWSALRAAGFLTVAGKPLAAASLRTTVRRLLPDAPPHDDWDGAQALSATGGNPEIAERLRTLFLNDLQVNCRAIEQALRQSDWQAAGNLLHKMKAACGFVGAARLLAATRALADAPDDPVAEQAFIAACSALTATPD